ncbi:MAG: hypothetical protein M9904_02430 [Chitinophagaceae bacterium]|nr:hypothetical protein [Chitinophagaceae bacterium]
MFSSSYPFYKINHTKPGGAGTDKLIQHNYAFTGKSKKRYIVVVEEYNYFVFIVKFCLQERKCYSDKYNHLSGLNECSRVLTTVGQIMKEIYSKNPYASFGFIGSDLPGEGKENTKRFRLYAKVVEQVISPVNFEHKTSVKHSAYLLINRDNNEPDLMNKMQAMFDRIYIIS